MLHERVLVPSSYGAQIPMDVYVPRASREIEPDIRRPAIVICPGGAYRACCEREAAPVALRFLMEGFNVFVIWYRVHCAQDEAPKQHDAAQWYSASPDHRFPMPSTTLPPAWPMCASMPRNFTPTPTALPSWASLRADIWRPVWLACGITPTCGRSWA